MSTASCFRSFARTLRFSMAIAALAATFAATKPCQSQEPAPPAQPDPAQQPAPQQPAPAQQPATDQPQPAAQPQTPTQSPTAPAAAPAAQTGIGASAPVAEAPSPKAPATASAPGPHAGESRQPGITEEELKQMLVGKALYLRGGYLDNSLTFDEHGRLIGHSPAGSYTLNGFQVEKVRLTKHKVELYGSRYGLHFVGQLAYEDPATAADRVKITPKKKTVKITIDREVVVKPKKVKAPKESKQKSKDKAPGARSASVATLAPGSATPAANPGQATPAAQPEENESELSETDQLKASIAAAAEAERPADAKSVTTTTSPAHATLVLKEALDRIFAPGLDAHMMDAMPDFWKLYYKAVEAKADYRPSDPSILRQTTVDRKARLITTFEPDSNEWAQAAGVAGMALYHVVVNPDGKAGEVAVARPIGFGLDESAFQSIRKAQFEPAMKDGKPVPVLLDLVVQFRIFSKRTAVHSPPEEAAKTPEKQLPGPYTVQNMPKPEAAKPAEPNP